MYKGSFVALSVMLQADPFLSALHNLIHLAPALIGGGAPTTENSQRTLQKNAIAGVLLEHGFDIHWTELKHDYGRKSTPTKIFHSEFWPFLTDFGLKPPHGSTIYI